MNGITSFSADGTAGAAMNASAMPAASQGFLAMQGNGLANFGEFGGKLLGVQPRGSLFLEHQKKSGQGWNPVVAEAASDMFALDCAPAPIEQQARPRHAHPTSVIRTRYRYRTR